MGNRTLLRPDGSEVRVDDADAGRLLALGYKEKSGASIYEEGISTATENHYSDPLSKFRTYREGELSGLSLGISDMVFGDDEDYKQRAHYNPVPRLTGEVAGAFAPVIPGVSEARGILPVVKLAQLAEEGGAAIGAGSKIMATMARGAIEGAGYGAGGAITSAKLEGDPVTAQAVLAGMGQGALWGGGLAGLGAGVQARLESRAARIAAEEAGPSRAELLAREGLERAEGDARVHGVLREGLQESIHDAKVVEDYHYDNLRSAIVDAKDTLKRTVTGMEEAVESVKDINFKDLGHAQKTISNQLVENHLMMEVRGEQRAFTREFALAQQAAKEGNYEKMVTHLDKFKENMVVMETKLGGKKFFDSDKVVSQANDLMGLAKLRIENATRASTTAAEMNTIHTTLESFPKNATEFANMRASKVEKLAAAVDSLQKLKVGEFAGVQQAATDAVDHMSQALGITMEGTPGQRLQGIWKLMKEAGTKRAKESLEMATKGNLLWEKANTEASKVERAGAEAAHERSATAKMGKTEKLLAKTLGYSTGSWTGKKLGIGYPGYLLGQSLVMGLVGLKGAVLGTLSNAAMKFTPKAMRGLQIIGPKLQPLATRLDGTLDDQKKDKKALMDARMREINEAAPSIRDTLYRAVEPVGIEHPEFAQALHEHAVSRFQYLMSKMPKDPGLAYSKLKSMWKADPVEIEKFSRVYEAFHDPVGVLTRAIQTGKISNEAADFIQNADPELWNHFRAELLMRVSDPEVNLNLKYADQVHLSALTGIPFHASMDPRFIAASQQMHTERNQPLEMNPRIQPGGGAGRPAGPGPSATSAQRTTEH